MNKLFLSLLAALGSVGTAVAADLPVKAPPPAPVVPPYSWTGCYIGANVGGAWRGGDGWTDSRFGVGWGGRENGRFIGGGQVGCNYQVNQFVIGAEWDGDWTSRNDRSVTLFVPGVGNLAASASSNAWVSTVAARFGVAFDRVLLYGKVGGGWGGASGDLSIVNLTTGNALLLSGGGSRSGWVVGAGLEWGFADNWSAKFEWDVLGRSGDTFFVPVGAPFLAGDTFTTGNRNIQMVKVGLNYRFNWGRSAY